jgi:heme/copper-type cytochrome/quinol oxidase subunit 1
MSIQKTGAVVSRAAGVVLLIIAGSSLLSWPLFEPSGQATSGWTSYSPLATNVTATSGLVTQLHDTYYTAFSSPGFYLPSAVQGIAGLVMILFSRRIGCWLAGGLSDGDTNNAA